MAYYIFKAYQEIKRIDDTYWLNSQMTAAPVGIRKFQNMIKMIDV